MEIEEARRERRKAEWRCTRCCSDLLSLKLKKKYVTDIINKSRCEFYKSFITKNNSNQKKLFSATKKLLNHTDETPYPPFDDKINFANEIGSYFIDKICNIQLKLDNKASEYSARPSSSNNCLRPFPIMVRFSRLSENDVGKLIECSAKKICKVDPMPPPLVVNCIDSLLLLSPRSSIYPCLLAVSLTNGNVLLSTLYLRKLVLILYSKTIVL